MIFNADYNQKTRYGFAETALQDILQVQGDEALVVNAAEKMQPLWYNLWYEWPIDQRGSDTYRGYWGTLMQLIVSNGMYDNQGLSYVDLSFNVDDFGFNTYSVSGMPKRGHRLPQAVLFGSFTFIHAYHKSSRAL